MFLISFITPQSSTEFTDHFYRIIIAIRIYIAEKQRFFRSFKKVPIPPCMRENFIELPERMQNIVWIMIKSKINQSA